MAMKCEGSPLAHAADLTCHAAKDLYSPAIQPLHASRPQTSRSCCEADEAPKTSKQPTRIIVLFIEN